MSDSDDELRSDSSDDFLRPSPSKEELKEILRDRNEKLERSRELLSQSRARISDVSRISYNTTFVTRIQFLTN
jgi:hypothetical protein